MSGRIPEAFIQDLLARTDIVAVIEPRLQLKRAGREFQALCPFHGEKTPSFTVSPAKQFYHCFGCGAHGNVLGFLMEFDRLEFVDAVEELASLAGLEVPREAGQADQRRPDQELYGILAEAEQYFRNQLKATPGAVRYLKDRGLSGELAARYRLGVAPNAWQGLTDVLGTSSERQRLLAGAGLINRSDEGRAYDRFRDRIIFPIHDSRGRPIAFGGRVYGADADGPKYLNSPETDLFHKGRQLYGLWEARQQVGRLERLVVVEGYMDVLALAQFGIAETVATLGTATTEDHARLLFRSAPEVVFCFDGDRAGRQAATRAMESVLGSLQEGRQVRFLFVPEGEDPDSLVRKEGEAAFRDRLARATPFSEFFFAHFRADVDMTSLDGRSRFVALCRPLIERIPAGAFRDMMSERLAELARTTSVQLGAAAASSGATGSPVRRPSQSQKGSLVRQAIALLVGDPTLAQEVAMPDHLEALQQPGLDLLVEIWQWCGRTDNPTTGRLLEAFSEHRHRDALGRLAMDAARHELERRQFDPRRELEGVLVQMERQAIRRRLQQLELEVTGMDRQRFEEQIALKQRLNALSMPTADEG